MNHVHTKLHKSHLAGFEEKNDGHGVVLKSTDFFKKSAVPPHERARWIREFKAQLRALLEGVKHEPHFKIDDFCEKAIAGATQIAMFQRGVPTLSSPRFVAMAYLGTQTSLERSRKAPIVAKHEIMKHAWTDREASAVDLGLLRSLCGVYVGFNTFVANPNQSDAYALADILLCSYAVRSKISFDDMIANIQGNLPDRVYMVVLQYLPPLAYANAVGLLAVKALLSPDEVDRLNDACSKKPTQPQNSGAFGIGNYRQGTRNFTQVVPTPYDVVDSARGKEIRPKNWMTSKMSNTVSQQLLVLQGAEKAALNFNQVLCIPLNVTATDIQNLFRKNRHYSLQQRRLLSKQADDVNSTDSWIRRLWLMFLRGDLLLITALCNEPDSNHISLLVFPDPCGLVTAAFTDDTIPTGVHFDPLGLHRLTYVEVTRPVRALEAIIKCLISALEAHTALGTKHPELFQPVLNMANAKHDHESPASGEVALLVARHETMTDIANLHFSEGIITSSGGFQHDSWSCGFIACQIQSIFASGYLAAVKSWRESDKRTQSCCDELRSKAHEAGLLEATANDGKTLRDKLIGSINKENVVIQSSAIITRNGAVSSRPAARQAYFTKTGGITNFDKGWHGLFTKTGKVRAQRGDSVSWKDGSEVVVGTIFYSFLPADGVTYLVLAEAYQVKVLTAAQPHTVTPAPQMMTPALAMANVVESGVLIPYAVNLTGKQNTKRYAETDLNHGALIQAYLFNQLLRQKAEVVTLQIVKQLMSVVFFKLGEEFSVGSMQNSIKNKMFCFCSDGFSFDFKTMLQVFSSDGSPLRMFFEVRTAANGKYLLVIERKHESASLKAFVVMDASQLQGDCLQRFVLGPEAHNKVEIIEEVFGLTKDTTEWFFYESQETEYSHTIVTMYKCFLLNSSVALKCVSSSVCESKAAGRKYKEFKVVKNYFVDILEGVASGSFLTDLKVDLNAGVFTRVIEVLQRSCVKAFDTSSLISQPATPLMTTEHFENFLAISFAILQARHAFSPEDINGCKEDSQLPARVEMVYVLMKKSCSLCGSANVIPALSALSAIFKEALVSFDAKELLSNTLPKLFSYISPSLYRNEEERDDISETKHVVEVQSGLSKKLDVHVLKPGSLVDTSFFTAVYTSFLHRKDFCAVKLMTTLKKVSHLDAGAAVQLICLIRALACLPEMFTLYGHDEGPRRWVDAFRVINALVHGSRNDNDMFLWVADTFRQTITTCTASGVFETICGRGPLAHSGTLLRTQTPISVYSSIDNDGIENWQPCNIAVSGIGVHNPLDTEGKHEQRYSIMGGIGRSVWTNRIYFQLRSFVGVDPHANYDIVNATPFFAQEDSSKECTDADKCAALLRFIRGVQRLPVGALAQGQVVTDGGKMPRAVRSALDREFLDFAAVQRKFLPGDSSDTQLERFESFLKCELAKLLSTELEKNSVFTLETMFCECRESLSKYSQQRALENTNCMLLLCLSFQGGRFGHAFVDDIEKALMNNPVVFFKQMRADLPDDSLPQSRGVFHSRSELNPHCAGTKEVTILGALMLPFRTSSPSSVDGSSSRHANPYSFIGDSIPEFWTGFKSFLSWFCSCSAEQDCETRVEEGSALAGLNETTYGEVELRKYVHWMAVCSGSPRLFFGLVYMRFCGAAALDIEQKCKYRCETSNFFGLKQVAREELESFGAHKDSSQGERIPRCVYKICFPNELNALSTLKSFDLTSSKHTSRIQVGFFDVARAKRSGITSKKQCLHFVSLELYAKIKGWKHRMYIVKKVDVGVEVELEDPHGGDTITISFPFSPLCFVLTTRDIKNGGNTSRHLLGSCRLSVNRGKESQERAEQKCEAGKPGTLNVPQLQKALFIDTEGIERQCETLTLLIYPPCDKPEEDHGAQNLLKLRQGQMVNEAYMCADYMGVTIHPTGNIKDHRLLLPFSTIVPTKKGYEESALSEKRTYFFLGTLALECSFGGKDESVHSFFVLGSLLGKPATSNRSLDYFEDIFNTDSFEIDVVPAEKLFPAESYDDDSEEEFASRVPRVYTSGSDGEISASPSHSAFVRQREVVRIVAAQLGRKLMLKDYASSSYAFKKEICEETCVRESPLRNNQATSILMESNLLQIDNFVEGYSGINGNNCYHNKPNNIERKFSIAAAVPLTCNPDCDKNLGHIRQFLTCGSKSTSQTIKDLPNFPSTNRDGQTVLWLRNDDSMADAFFFNSFIPGFGTHFLAGVLLLERCAMREWVTKKTLLSNSFGHLPFLETKHSNLIAAYADTDGAANSGEQEFRHGFIAFVVDSSQVWRHFRPGTLH